MPVIGTFSAVKDGYAGTIRTLTMNVRGAARRQRPQGQPTARPTSASWPGTAEIGAAWRRTSRASDETYLQRQARRPRPAAADLGRPAREHRRRPRAPDLAARPEGRRLRRCAAMASTPSSTARTPRHQRRGNPAGQPSRLAAAATEPLLPSDEPHGRVPRPRRPARAAALRGRLLPLLPVPLHQRADRRRPRSPSWLSAPPTSGSSRRSYFLVFGRGPAPLRRAPRPLRAAPRRQPSCSSSPPPARSCSPLPTALHAPCSAAR